MSGMSDFRHLDFYKTRFVFLTRYLLFAMFTFNHFNLLKHINKPKHKKASTFARWGPTFASNLDLAEI